MQTSFIKGKKKQPTTKAYPSYDATIVYSRTIRKILNKDLIGVSQYNGTHLPTWPYKSSFIDRKERTRWWRNGRREVEIGVKAGPGERQEGVFWVMHTT